MSKSRKKSGNKTATLIKNMNYFCNIVPWVIKNMYYFRYIVPEAIKRKNKNIFKITPKKTEKIINSLCPIKDDCKENRNAWKGWCFMPYGKLCTLQAPSLSAKTLKFQAFSFFLPALSFSAFKRAESYAVFFSMKIRSLSFLLFFIRVTVYGKLSYCMSF